MPSLFCGISDSPQAFLNTPRFFISFLLWFIPIHAWSENYESGTYTESLSANGEDSTLSGNITVNLSSGATESAAVLAVRDGQISGTVDNLSINLLDPALNGI
nr:hypothetical protein [Endozoicomonas sp.]